ncbi:MAG TPA: sulfur carrier protein ThiS [Opitutales bacterium]|nr:sulfur carrier protein ThiS [Opitutales bacterium]
MNEVEKLTEITITANGSSYKVKDGEPLNDFLKKLDFDPALVVVERNLEALTPAERENVRLKEGDRLEIVRIVAGG